MADPVRVNLAPLLRFRDRIAEGLSANGGENNPIRRALRQWAHIFRAFLQERFNKFSRGGGWKPLAESTKRQRRGAQQGKSSQRGKRGKVHAATGVFSILRDTGILFNVVALAFTGAPGQLQEDIPFGMRVGYGGPARHPDGTATIADIASFHQVGGPHLPAREIVVPPDDPTQQTMGQAMDAAFQRLSKEGS